MWPDRPVFIVGGGPSLIGYDLSRLHERGYVLGVNKAAEKIPVHATFSLDRTFVERCEGRYLEWARHHPVFLAVDDTWPIVRHPEIVYLEKRTGTGLSLDPNVIHHGCNSGHGALDLAISRLGARDVYLLGFDMRKTEPDKPAHWHGSYEWHNRRAEIYFERWALRFFAIAAMLPEGVRVTNANPESAIRCFPFTSYEELGLKCRAAAGTS